MPEVRTDAERYQMGARMLAWRAKYNVTQESAARMLGVARESWARWERGEVYPLGYEGKLGYLVSGDPHEGRPREERFYQRKVRADHAIQRRLFRTVPREPSSGRKGQRRDMR